MSNFRCGEYATMERGAARDAREARKAQRAKRQVPQDQTGVWYLEMIQEIHIFNSFDNTNFK